MGQCRIRQKGDAVDARDREVLLFIGAKGKTPAHVGERFSGFDVGRLIHAGLVTIMRIPFIETHDRSGPSSAEYQDWYMLTPRGAEAVGIDPVMIGRV
jgi:hypothetical protein